MTVAVGRVSDIGIGVCSAHKTPIPVVVTLVTGAPTARVNALPTATAITVGLSSCGHASIALTFSALAKAEKAGIHRVGDTGALPGGMYTLVTGSPTGRAGG
jgi:hypothetical protein